MPAREPGPDRLPRMPARLLAATRPAFLGVTALAVGLGFATALRAGAPIDPTVIVLTLVFALMAHAAANAINDYHDALGGSDAVNTDRIFPFTGGSRLIQNQVLSTRAMARLGYGLLLAVAAAGLWLAGRCGWGLIPIGLAGIALAWAYSAPPLRLMARGIGEAAILGGWLLVVCGSDFVLRRRYALEPVAIGLPLCLQLAAILYLNQVPDARADARAGKRTLIVRIGPARALPGYLFLTLGAQAAVVILVWRGLLPPLALGTLLCVPLNLRAAAALLRHALQPARLRPAIMATIAAAHGFGVMLLVAVAFG